MTAPIDTVKILSGQHHLYHLRSKILSCLLLTSAVSLLKAFPGVMTSVSAVCGITRTSPSLKLLGSLKLVSFSASLVFNHLDEFINTLLLLLEKRAE